MLGNYKQCTLTPVTINVQKQQMTKVATQTEADGGCCGSTYLFALPLTCCQLTERLPD